MFKIFIMPDGNQLCGFVRPNLDEDAGMACDVTWAGWFPGLVYLEIAQELSSFDAAVTELSGTSQKMAEEIYGLMYLDATDDDDDVDKVVN